MGFNCGFPLGLFSSLFSSLLFLGPFAFGLCAIAPAPAWAQAQFPALDGHGTVHGGGVPAMVPMCVTRTGADIEANVAVLCGTHGTSASGTNAAPSYIVPATNLAGITPLSGSPIATSGKYIQVAASCPHGGMIENTSGIGGSAFSVDWSSGATANGTVLSPGATLLGPALATGQAGGKQQIPPTYGPVFIFGPSGATFRGSCS